MFAAFRASVLRPLAGDRQLQSAGAATGDDAIRGLLTVLSAISTAVLELLTVRQTPELGQELRSIKWSSCTHIARDRALPLAPPQHQKHQTEGESRTFRSST